MKPQWIIPLFVSLTLNAGCSSGDGPLELDYPEGQGAIHLSLDSADPILGTLHGMIRISRGATTVTEREFDPGGRARSYDIIYLEEGVYDVEVRLDDDEGNLAMFGERSGVHVIPGQLTSITIVLQSSGGVQVEVEVPGVPTRFSPVVEGHLPDCIRIRGDYYLSLIGTQRVDPETGETRYYAWVWNDDGFVYTLLQGSSPEGILDSECLPTSLDMSPERGDPGSVTVGGDYFYLVDISWPNILVHRSLDGVDWELFSTISPTFRPTSNGMYDFPYTCSIIIDNRFNIICKIADYYSHESGGDFVEYIIAHIFSPDGVEWSPFIYREDRPDMLQSDIRLIERQQYFYLNDVTFFYNTYVSWFSDRGVAAVSVSTDREVWSELIDLELSESSVFTDHLTPYFTESGIVLFRTAEDNSNVVIYGEE